MTESWQEVKRALEEETRKWSAVCPDELKRFQYGLITHSDAGKYAYNQYLGHYVHLYAAYFMLGSNMSTIEDMARDPRYDLEQMKDVVRRFTPVEWGYSGQKTMSNMARRMVSALDTLGSKDDLLELWCAWSCLVRRLHNWAHWYFPWGAGASICRRISKEDVKEMQRLLETA